MPIAFLPKKQSASQSRKKVLPVITQLSQFSPSSKVWIYTAARPLTTAECSDLQQELDRFVQQWTAHNAALKAHAEVFENQLIILVVDESQAGASGCSIDKSVRFLEQIGAQLGVDLFDRMRFGWVDDSDTIHFNSKSELTALQADGTLQPHTRMLNTLAGTVHDLKENWLLPLESSWHKRII